MALPGFIFGGDTGVTPERLKRDRAVAEAMLAGSARGRAPQNVGEGLNAIGQALMFRVADGRARKGEKVQSEKQADIWSKLGGAMGSGGAGAGFSTATGPIASASPAPSGTASIPTGERASYIRSGLVQRGLPEHVADGFLANFQDESGLDPGINERNPIVPGSRGGFGLYQLTGPRRREYEAFASKRGVDPSDMDAQMDFMMGELQGSERAAAERIFAAKDTAGAAQAIVTNFLRPAAEHRNSRVAKYAGLGGGMQAQAHPVQVASLDPSAGMASVPGPQTGTVPYTGPALRDPNEAIGIAPTGMPGSSPEMDAQIERFHAGNGTTPTQYGQGAPRAPLQGAVVGDAREMRAGGPQAKNTAVAQAMGLTGQGAQAPGMSPVASALAGQPPQPRPAAPPQLGVDPWTGMRPQDIAQASGALQMAQAAPAQGGGMDMRALVGIMSDPWASDEQREVAKFIYQDQVSRSQAAEERAYEASVLRDQRAYDAGLLRDERAYDDGVRREGFAREDGRNAYLDARQGNRDARADLESDRNYSKPPTSVQEFEYGLQNPGYFDQQERQRKAGATSINTGQNSNKFAEKSDEAAAGRLNDIVAAGNSAPAFLSDIQQLADLGREIGTGRAAQAMVRLGPWAEMVGIELEGLAPAQAYQSIISRLAPQMRPAGSGASSDFDARQFLQSLPSLGNTPEGNLIITDTFQAIQENMIQAAEIASLAYIPADQGGITWQEAERQIRALPNPYTRFREMQRSGTGGRAPDTTPRQDGVPVGGQGAPEAGADGWQTLPNGVRIRKKQ